MWWTRGERRRRRGNALGSHGADDQDGVDGAAVDGKRVEQCADGAAASRTPTPGSQALASQAQVRAAWAMRESAGVMAAGSSCDRGVDVAPTGRGGDVEGEVAVVPDRSQPRLPAPGKQRASRQQNKRGGAFAHEPMASASCIAPRRARSLRSRAGAGADIARARGFVRVHVQHAQRLRARSGRADRSCAACVIAGRAGGTLVDGGLVSLVSGEVGDDVDRRVVRLARILVPRRVPCDVCGWRVSCLRSGVCGRAVVLISRGG